MIHVFNESFTSGLFPKIRKTYKVCGVPKTTPCSSANELRSISLTSVLAKVQESYAVQWMHEDIDGEISDVQYGGLPVSSAALALVNLLHKWCKAMGEPYRVVRIVYLDFCKAFDLIDHNKQLENFKPIGVRPALVSWLASIAKIPGLLNLEMRFPIWSI